MAVALSSTPMLSAHDEPTLVTATRAGDDRAFEALYARYRERIFAFILSRVHDHGRAEDIAQDVFISALRRLRAGDQEIAFKPWIYEIAKNACIDEFRRGSRSREVPLEADADPTGERPALLSAAPTPPAAVESRLRMDDLRGAFGGLSDTHHRLLVLREFEGLSYDEIGKRLNMNRQMVESGLFRARRKLTEEYQELASGRRCEQVQVAIEAGSLASARTLGLRDRRRFARHLSHCQACRHIALLAGVDAALVKPRSIPAKIAALLPFPLARLRWPGGRGRGRLRPASPGSHQLSAAAVQSAPALVEQGGGSALALGPAAVAAAALAIAGIGGGLLHNATASGHAGRPALPSKAPAVRTHVHPGGSSSSSASLSGGRPARFGTAGPGGSTRAPLAPGAGRGASPGGSGARPSSSASPAGGIPGRLPALSGATGAATAPVKRVASGVGSTTQQVVSTTQRVAAGVGGTVSKVTGAVTGTISKTVQGVAKTVQGAANTVQGVTQTVQGAANTVQGQATTPGPAATSAPGSGATSPVSGAVQGVTQTTGQATQTVGQTVHSLLP